MVILIGGAGCTGKTKLSNRLMRKLGIPYVSVDHIMMGFYRSNPDCGFTPMSKKEVIAEKLWPFLREVIKTNIENEHSIIFEGIQFLPKHIHEFNSEYAKNINAVFLCFSEEYINTRYADILANRMVIEKRNDVEGQSQMILDNVYLIASCEEHNVKHFIITEDYPKDISKVENYVLSQP